MGFVQPSDTGSGGFFTNLLLLTTLFIFVSAIVGATVARRRRSIGVPKGCFEPRSTSRGLPDEIETCVGIGGIAARQDLRNDHTRTINAEMELLPSTFPLLPVLGGRPFAFANDRESCAIDNEMDGLVGRGAAKPDIEILAAAR
jgi:hypothetical protein